MHHAQDYILTIGSLIFIIALIPSVLSEHKPALSTSVSTMAVLYVFAGVYVSLHLWLTTVTTFLSGTMWAILAVQKWRQTKSDEE